MDIDKLIVSSAKDIRTADDMEILLNDILNDFRETGNKSKAFNDIVDVIIQMMNLKKQK